MSPDTCSKHVEIATGIARIEEKLDNYIERACKHIEEGEAPVTGYRDRLIAVEMEISAIKKSYWKACLVSGLLGGLVGKLTPDLLTAFLKIVGL